MHYYPDVSQWFPFINCIEGAGSKPTTSAPQCASQTGLDYNKIETCAFGTEGNGLMHQVATATNNLQPAHQWTPWVVINGKPLDSAGLDERLTKVVCDAYTGVKPAACNSVSMKYLISRADE